MMDFRASATKDLSVVLDRLAQAADAAIESARAKAAAEAQIAIDAVNAQRMEILRALTEQTDARAALERAHAQLETERSRLRDEADALRAQLDRFRAQSESQRGEADALRNNVQALRAERDSLQHASDTLLAESIATQQDLTSKLGDALRAAEDTRARAAQATAEQARAIRDQAIALVSRTLDRLLAVSATFATVSSGDEVLAAVVDSLATEFRRVALFKVGLDRLEAVQHVGFDFPSDYTHLEIPQEIAAILDRAVTSGQIEMLSAEALAQAAGTPFGGTPACALALPIDLEGDLCAVLYADDSDQPYQAFAATELRRTFALILRQLAAPLLVRLPAEMKAIGELRAYAANLVTELENMYAADVSAHKKGADLRRRLQDNLECARGIYAQRVSSEAPAARALLEEELTLAARSALKRPFGRDLTAILGAAAARAEA
ncbi:MAG TPA: hypothetical protein VKB52_07035 [Rhodanobacteraceae bacterium]|nr:hypothetical protein [Rhodanobacteraceae bacterium]